MLLLQDVTGRRRWWAFNLARATIVGLVMMAAGWSSIWPLYLLAVLTGAAAIGLPLHAHRLARVVGVAGWTLIAAAAGAVAIAALGADEMRLVWTAAVGLPLVVGIGLCLLSAVLLVVDELPSAERTAQRAVAGSALVAVAAFAAWWISSGGLSDRFVRAPDAVSRWLLFSSLTSVLAGLLAAATGAFILSLDRMSTDVRRKDPLRVSVSERPFKIKRLPRPKGQAARLIWRLHQLNQRLRRSLVSLRNQVVKGAVAAANTMFDLANEVGNWVRRRLTLLGRRVVFVLRHGRRIARAGFTAGLAAVDYVWRPILASTCAIAGAIAALHLAQAFTHYLVDGPIDGLAAGAGWSVLGLAACFSAAERLSSVETRTMARAVNGILSNAGPDVVLFTVLAGWVVGIPGTLGYGPIHVGWVTCLGSIALAIVMAPEWMRERRTSSIDTAFPAQPAAGTP